MTTAAFAIRRIDDAADAALPALSRLLQTTFADPDTVLELDRIQAFLTEASPARQFCVVVAETAGEVLGGTIFSYVPQANCGFSEYLLVRKDHHGQRIGRRLFDARRAILDDLAQRSHQAPCNGLFIEADNPERTPPDLQARERETAIDALVRLHVFAHLGFWRVDVEYVQPPLGPDKQPVTYLDLLFAPWDARVRGALRLPAGWVVQTLRAIWESWAPATAHEASEALRARLGDTPVALARLTPQSDDQ
ncbi:MAG TPA: GNAT family N-acetyltransferase [Chloroflexota bacterium]|nr:GNAT family N-acetyltransferase [Chloroflexota bacterium]